MFRLEMGNKEDWIIIYTQKHSDEDISSLTGELLSTVKRVHESLIKHDLFSIMELNMADTSNLLSILGETEKCTGWNMFDKRGTKEIIGSLLNMLCTYEVYDLNGVEMSKW